MRLLRVVAWLVCGWSLATGFLATRAPIRKVSEFFKVSLSSPDSRPGVEIAKPKLTLTSLQRQIFCNVELNGANLEAVGFDMDFTLAQYNEAFDLLAFDGAKRKLVEVMGYPKEVLDIPYSSTDFRRGLIIDKMRGNILKVDRHRYVRHAMHGLREMTADERKNTYMNSVHSFTESHYAQIDTLFLLVDALLFAHLVDFKNSKPDEPLLGKKSFEQIYRDIRNCVDLCHRDGVIKGAVMREPSKYIIHDEGTVSMLKRLKQAGKKTFLLQGTAKEMAEMPHYHPTLSEIWTYPAEEIAEKILA